MSVIYKIDADFDYADSLTESWVTVYDPTNMDLDGDCMHDISFDWEIGSAGSLSFKVPRTHTNWGSFVVLATSIRLWANGDIIWYGRVYSVKTDFWLERTITCEGALAFLGDILIRPFRYFHEQAAPDPSQGSEYAAWTGKTVHIDDPQPGWQLLTDVITKYNLYASNKRKFTLLNYDSDLLCMSDDILYTGVDDYTAALSVINNILNNDNSATLHWVPTNNGIGLYVMQIDGTNYWQTGGGTIALASNLTDYSLSADAGDIFTQCIPLDKDKNTLLIEHVDQTIPKDCVPSTNRSKYGAIEKTYSYGAEASNIELYEIGQAVIDSEDALIGGLTTPSIIQVGAVDMALLPDSVAYIMIGRTYTITSNVHDLSLLYNCTGIKIKLDEPGAATYTFVKPGQGADKPKKLTDMVNGQYYGWQPSSNNSVSSYSKYDTEEAPERLVKIDDYHVAAVMNGRVEHYVLHNFATDEVTYHGDEYDQEHYELAMYETDIPTGLPPKPVPNNQEEQNGQT